MHTPEGARAQSPRRLTVYRRLDEARALLNVEDRASSLEKIGLR